MRIEIHSPLNVRRAPKGALTPWLKGRASKWILTTPFVVSVDGEVYIVPSGYIFNGSSIPWWLWAVWPPTYSPAWQGSCFHDYCYSHLWKRVSKEWADEAFYHIMLADGASSWVARKFYWAVSTFGKGGW